MVLSFFTNLRSDAEIVSSIHNEPFLQPFETTKDHTRIVIIAFCIISCIHLTILYNLKSLANNNKKKTSILPQEQDAIMKMSYQATNLSVNFFLGCYGLFTILNAPSSLTLILPGYGSTLLQRITEFEEYTFFSSVQLGYNLWALPVGILFVNENSFMILHHISVLTSCSLACYTNITYRVFNPYVFGCAELSSIPLAIMNYLKDQREWTRKNFESGFSIIKLVFAIMFLLLRVIIATPLILDLLRSSFLVIYTSIGLKHVTMGKMLICGINFFLMCCLGFLQYYWAYLIVGAVVGGKLNSHEKKKV